MAASSVMPPVRVVPVMVQLMPLVWSVRVALVLLVVLTVMFVPQVPRASAPLVTLMVRALLVMHWWVAPSMVLRR